MYTIIAFKVQGTKARPTCTVVELINYFLDIDHFDQSKFSVYPLSLMRAIIVI